MSTHDDDLATRLRKIRLGDENETRLVIAIDFGTTYSGVAYAHSSLDLSNLTPEQIRDKIVAVRKWPYANQFYSEKTPTLLAYEDGRPTAWGGKVKPSHSTQISHFKLGLHIPHSASAPKSTGNALSGGFANDPKWRHPSMPDKNAVNYVSDYLKFLRQHILNEVLPKEFGKEFLARQLIKYVVTVPAIWSHKATDLTREAALNAGFEFDELILVTEPEAAALYCSTLCNEVNLNDGDRFLICDAGGGTVVILFSAPISNHRT
jgi:molecular chaperone DnaK (HSP70)